LTPIFRRRTTDLTMVKPVYALVGADAFLQLERLGDVLRALPEGVQRTDLDGERAELADVLDDLRSFAMFGGGKIVVVRNADAFIARFREQLEDYVASPSDSATLVLRLNSLPANQRIHKAIVKNGKIEDCNPPKDISRWLTDRARTAHGLALTPDAARLLADLIGDDLGRLDNELAKLAIDADGGGDAAGGVKVGPERIVGTVTFQREQEMWDMTNELAAGHPADALRRWRQLIQLDPSAEFRAVTWLGMWLENVRKALAMKRKGLNAFSIAQQLRIWPRELQAPFMQTAESLGDRGVARALDLLAQVDHHSKSGVGDAATNVERFILDLGAGMKSR
jgi:DNA polymerase III delta subunit